MLTQRGEYSTLQLLFEGSHESTKRVSIMTKYATFLMQPAVKVLVLVFFVAVTLVSTYINFFVLVAKFDQQIRAVHVHQLLRAGGLQRFCTGFRTITSRRCNRR